MDKASIKHGNVETIPTFERRLQDMRCCDGDAITLECNVHAVPEPIIIWEKDGRVLSSTCKDFEMRYDGEKATLSILRVYPEDEGEYTCIAKNNIGRSFSSACVLVDVPEEKENMLSKQLHRPSGFLSTTSTPRSTPRATPIRNVSPLRLSYRATSIDLSTERRRFAAPKFYAIPNGRVVEEGDTVEFQCAIAGHPMPWATWDKDGMIVAQTSRIIIKERDDLRFLEIEDVNFDDAGLYRVTLENDFGRVEATARLDVIAKPRPDRSKSTRAVRSSSRSRSGFHMSRRIMGPSTQIGGRLALASAFRGSSVPSSKYYHNGDEVEESNRIHFEVIDNYTHSLIIDNVDKSDEGIYTCIAQNEDGIISTTTSVAFYDHNNDIPETEPIILKQLPKQIRTIEGQITDLSFEIESFEPYSYIWYRNDEMLLNNDEFRFIDHGNGILALRIMDTFDLDAGRYSCTVMTRNGSCSTYCDLIVEEDRLNYNDYDLEILKKPQPVLGFPGSIVSFCAKVYPPDAITNWSICGREISDDSREYSLESQSDGLRILHILGIEYYHSGEVKCTVIHPNNKLINLSAYTNLTILPSSLPNQNIFNFENTESNETPDLPVYITKGPDDCTALVGGTIVLKVHFGGKPIPKVYWFKAGHPVVESSNIKITSTDTNSILQITDITTDDSGKYTVEIMNDYSSDYAVASVAVESPPEPPSKPSISATYDRISIAWCGPPYDGGCVITGFIIEMQENSSEWIEIAHVVDSLAYTIKDVKPKVIYRFRVRAENIHGHSEPSKPSDETILQIPEIINENYDEIENRKKLLLLKQGGDFKQRFETLEELGKGRFGVVYKVIERETGQTMAAKVIKCIKARDRVKVQEEIAIMKSLEHPKLLQLAVSFETNREIIMIMEYITGGELFERVVADDFTLTERDCILFLRQICEGVDYMHSQSIVHLDLKPENIMCYTRTSHQIKIIDFGLAQRLNSDSPVRVLFGTPEFIAPEIINYEPISFQTDMWSVGVICYVLLSGLSPFMGDADVDTFANITRADYDFDDEAFDAISQEAKDFISNLLVHRKEDRLTAKECLESKWLSQYHDENLINKRICTDKLKKFIIRRKWQKTGNAIRALGRMANLSASRRNSAISATGSSTSLSNSPRPSISAGCGQTNSLLNPNIVNHMTSVNEEEDDGEIITSAIVQVPKVATIIESKIIQRPKIRNKTECSERSDSGFSECSNCSGGGIGGNISCLCPHPILEKPQAIQEEILLEKINEFSVGIPHDILKIKLEEVASKHQEMIDNELHIEEVEALEMEKQNRKKNSCSSIESFKIFVPTLNYQDFPKIVSSTDVNTIVLRTNGSADGLNDKNLESTTVVTPKEAIMKSDFTNTISMRKKSLENNFAKEKSRSRISKPILGPLGKVSMLKNRFNQNQTDNSGSNKAMPGYMRTTLSRSTSSSPVKSSMGREFSKSKNVFDRLAYNPKTNATATMQTKTTKYSPQSLSLPGSPLPQMRSTASIRLSNKVRETTERLSAPKFIAVSNNSNQISTTLNSFANRKLNTFKQLNINSDLVETAVGINMTSSTTEKLLKNNNNNSNILNNNNNNFSNISSIKINSSTCTNTTNIEKNNFDSKDSKKHDLEHTPRNYNTRS
ncbi:titin homolog isoform X1 [Condylostylus longicornis]|nr:titin homolog isoform X1 [Condylostylus longicornis]